MKCTPRNGNCGSGTGIDQVPHQVLPLRPELVILAAERHDARFAALAGQRRHAVGMQPRAGNQKVGRELAGGGYGAPARALAAHRIHARAGDHAAPRAASCATQHFADLAGNPRCLPAARAAPPRRPRAARSRASPRAPASAGPRARWRCRARADRAGAPTSSSSTATTSLPQTSWGMPISRQNSTICRMPADRQSRLHRPRLVVQAAVQHAAVVPGLVAAHAGLLFQHADPRARETLGQAVSRGQPHDAAADNHHPLGIHGEPPV